MFSIRLAQGGGSTKVISESPIGKLDMLKLTVFALLLSQLVPVMLTSYFKAFGESASQERLRTTVQFESVESGPLEPATRILAAAPRQLPVEAVISMEIDATELLLFEEPDVQIQAIQPLTQHNCERVVMPSPEQLEPVNVADGGASHVPCGLPMTKKLEGSLLR